MKGNITLSPTETLELLQEGLKNKFGDAEFTSVKFYSYQDHTSRNLSDFNTIDIEFGDDES